MKFQSPLRSKCFQSLLKAGGALSAIFIVVVADVLKFFWYIKPHSVLKSYGHYLYLTCTHLYIYIFLSWIYTRSALPIWEHPFKLAFVNPNLFTDSRSSNMSSDRVIESSSLVIPQKLYYHYGDNSVFGIFGAMMIFDSFSD